MLRVMMWAVAFLSLLSSSAQPKKAGADDQQAIREVYTQLTAALNARNVDRIMSFYVSGDDLVVFDVVPPHAYVGPSAVRKDFEDFFAAHREVQGRVEQLEIVSDGTLAFTHYFLVLTGTDTQGRPVRLTLRGTDGLQKRGGRWRIAHEHISVPVNLDTRQAELNP